MKYLFDVDIPLRQGNAFLTGTIKNLGGIKAIDVKMELTVGSKVATLTAPCCAIGDDMCDSIASAIEGFVAFCGFDWDRTPERQQLHKSILEFAESYREND